MRRSDHWRSLEKRTIKAHSFCSACSRKHQLEVHHKKPFALHPTEELNPSNLIVLCLRCHLLVGHLDDWKSFNHYVESDAKIWSNKITKRPKNEHGGKTL